MTPQSIKASSRFLKDEADKAKEYVNAVMATPLLAFGLAAILLAAHIIR